MSETIDSATNPAEVAVALYAALLDGRGAIAAMEAVASRLGASSHATHLVQFRNGRAVRSVSAGKGGLAQGSFDAYSNYWVRHDPWARALRGLEPGVHDMARIVPAETLKASRFWTEWGQARDAALHCLAVPLQRQDGAASGVFFYRRDGEPPFGAEDQALLGAIFPHLCRVVQAEATLSAAREASATALHAALDALAEGVVLIDASRRRVFVNAALGRMAAASDGLVLSAEGIEAPSPASRLALSRAVTAALAAAEGRLGLLPSAGSLALPRPSGKAPWLVRAVPVVRGASPDLPRAFCGAMLLVSDGEHRARPSAALLSRMFGLTAAEAALGAALATGDSIAEHAARRGISVETARSQMQAIRRKTGCTRQADLAVLLARLPG